MAETVKHGSVHDQPGREGMRPVPPPVPYILKKDRFRLIFNEPREQGCISIDIDGSGGLSMFLSEGEMIDLCAALFAAHRRIKRNRRAKG